MAHPSLLVLGYSEAAMFLRQGGAAEVKAVLSIHGRHEHAVDAPGVPHRLDLHFDDADAPDPADPLAVYRAWCRRKWAEANGRPETPPTAADARAIVEFARAIRDVEGTLLCHCRGGVSRSPAAALSSLAVWAGPGREREYLARLLRARPCAAPHAGLIALGDELLCREGRLVSAVRDGR